MKYAWIENEKVRDISPGNPFEWYHSEIASFYNTEVPDDAENGDGWINDTLVKPGPISDPTPAPRRWNVDDIRSNLTLSEKVTWDSTSDAHVVTAKIEMATSKGVADTTAILEMLVTANIISQASMTKILA